MPKLNPIPNPLDMTTDEAMSNLYLILIQYYKKLCDINHPLIHLITEILDDLIAIKKNDFTKEQVRQMFELAHSKAFKNITTIYDYDKEQEDSNKLEIDKTIEDKIQDLSI
jgi:hypothetical protein